MTGTVLDGNIDVAALRTDGEEVQAFGPWLLAPYSAQVRELLVRALEAAQRWQFDPIDPPIFAEAETALTTAQAFAVSEFLRVSNIPASEVAVIGFHGQTVLHRPPQRGRDGATRQLGDGALMAKLTGIDVVYNFRTADVRGGGQGAPLAAAYHASLLKHCAGDAVLNLGGVGNITWCGPNGELAAFDTGPANAPINDWVKRVTGAAMDYGGALARSGRVDEARLARMLAHPYFRAPYPKSLDRFGFSASLADGLSPADGAATLSAFVAAAVGCALDLLPQRPKRLIVCGGGRHNPAIMEALAARATVDVAAAETVGWRGDAIEAECFAYLAMRTLRGLPSSYPSTTGVARPTVAGQLAKAAA